MRQYLQRANAATSIFLAFLIGFLAAPAASAQAPAGPPGGPPQASSDVQIGFLFQPQVKVGADYASYELPQARLSFRGSLTEQTRFFTQVNLARQGAVLLDARLNHWLTETLDLEAGVYMTPFGREQQTNPALLPFEDRARVVRALGPYWQTGAGLTYHIVPDGVRARFGVYNGNGDVNLFNDNQSFMYLGRLEGTVRGENIRWDLGASAALSDDGGVSLSDLGMNAFEGRRLLFGADFVADAERFYVIGETIYASLAPEVGAERNPFGAFGRFGFRFTPEQSIALGVDYFDPDGAYRDPSGRNYDDLMFAASYSHYFGRYLRFLIDYSFIPDEIDSGNLVLRLQLARL